MAVAPTTCFRFRAVTLAPPIMTFNSTDNPSPIFENGKLKPGIYKIQNIYAETYLDIEVHSRELRCRSANDLREGMGLVRPYPSLRLVSDH